MDLKSKNNGSDIIRVLYVNPESSIAGAEESLLLFVRFAPKTVQISVACPKGILTDKLRLLGIKAFKISSLPRRCDFFVIRLFYLVIANLQLSMIASRVKPQIIHANGAKAVLVTVLAGILTQAKVIWHMRDLRITKLQAQICGSFSSKIITVSQAVKNMLMEIGIKSELIEVINNGVDIDDIATGKKNQNNPFIFANIGQFVPWKGQLSFIQAAETYFLQENSDVNFLLIGDDIFGRDGRYKKQLFDRVRTSPFKQKIKILSWQNDLKLLWPKIDCLIHTADAEPFGRVIIEAMAHGIPVIAAASGGPAEIINDGCTGLLFDPDDIERLLAAMNIVAKNKNIAHALAVKARECVISNYSAAKTAKKIINVYKKLMAA